MRIPEIAERLNSLALQHGLPELRDLAHELRRRPPVSKAEPTSRPSGSDLKAQIRIMAFLHPDWSQVRIANHFSINPGRVSEALRGKRT